MSSGIFLLPCIIHTEAFTWLFYRGFNWRHNQWRLVPHLPFTTLLHSISNSLPLIATVYRGRPAGHRFSADGQATDGKDARCCRHRLLPLLRTVLCMEHSQVRLVMRNYFVVFTLSFSILLLLLLIIITFIIIIVILDHPLSL